MLGPSGNRRAWTRGIGAVLVSVSLYLVLQTRFVPFGAPVLPVALWMVVSGRIGLVSAYIGAAAGLLGLWAYAYLVVPFLTAG